MLYRPAEKRAKLDNLPTPQTGAAHHNRSGLDRSNRRLDNILKPPPGRDLLLIDPPD